MPLQRRKQQLQKVGSVAEGIVIVLEVVELSCAGGGGSAMLHSKLNAPQPQWRPAPCLNSTLTSNIQKLNPPVFTLTGLFLPMATP